MCNSCLAGYNEVSKHVQSITRTHVQCAIITIIGRITRESVYRWSDGANNF